MNQHRQYGRRDEQETHDGDRTFLGVNLRLAPDKLPPGLLADSENNRMSNGEVEPRRGVIKPGFLNVTAALTDAGIRPVVRHYGAGVFTDPDSFEWVMLAADGYIYRCKENNARHALGMPTGVKILSDCTFTQAFNKVYCFRGRYLAPLVLPSVDDDWQDIIQHYASTDTYDAAVTVLEREAEEIAYGPFVTLATEVTLGAGELTSASTTATVTHAAHGYSTGDIITISGATQTEYNGDYTITVTGLNTFTYTFAGSGTSPATGTIKMVKSAVVSVGDLVTVTCPTSHGFITGADITFQGATQTEYNGRFNITVVDDETFTFQFTGSATARATGTIQCSNMSRYYEALGSQVTLTSLTQSAGTATATKTAHGFSSGQYVTIEGATPAAYNGTFLITVPTADTFTFAIASATASPATGTITARTSIVLAGQSPDTNPEAWNRVYNVLPNADNAVFINNCLVVPTAYTPGVDGYDSTASTYTKKDFLVAMDVLDEVHFNFVNEFRINQGSDDEIVDVLKYDNNNLLVFKGKSWGIVSNIRIGLDNVTLDMKKGNGLAARGAAWVWGRDVYLVTQDRGIARITQTSQGLLQVAETPFSNDIEPWVRRINWNLKHLIRMAGWDNKLYVACPMDDCSVDAATDNLLPTGAQWQLGTQFIYNTYTLDVTAGQTYYFEKAADTYGLSNDGVTITASGVFIATSSTVVLTRVYSFPPPLGTAVIQSAIWLAVRQCNNAILVHDFRNLGRVQALLGAEAQAWAGRDTGSAICPKEFILTNIGGRERLCFTAADGFVNLYEHSTAGDEVRAETRDNMLGWADIETLAVTRGYTHEEIMPKKFPYLELGLSVWNARFSLAASTGHARSTKTLLTDKEFSRTTYLRPFDRAAWVATNANDDFAEPHRGNYSVALTDDGFYCGSALTLGQRYDAYARYSTRTLTGGYVQFSLTNDQGRCTLKAVSPAAQAGPRRMGVIV